MPSTVKRAVQLGLLAKDMACVRLNRHPEAVHQARCRLAERMGKLHGLPQKIGQILALGELGDSMPVYAPLTESPTTMTQKEAFALIEESLGKRLKSCFRSIEGNGIGSSLGQVHRAELLDGRTVAVKVQYPGIADDLALDLRALGWLTGPIGGLRRGLDLRAYQREVGSMLRRELDYVSEAEAIRQFGNRASDTSWLDVPEVLPELSNERILTMTWLDGENFSEVRRWNVADREEAGRSLLRLFLTGCLQWNCLHADPHPGNYRFRRVGNQVCIGLLDFGCVKSLSPSVSGALANMLELTARGPLPASRALDLFVALGFNPVLLQSMAHLLPEVIAVLTEPFTWPGPTDVRKWNVGERLATVLGPCRWNFRVAGPAELIYFIRAFQGLVHYLAGLEVAINWRAVLSEVLRDLPEVGAFEPNLMEAEQVVMKSQYLRIAVTDNGKPRVELTFGAGATESLPDLVPPELEERLAALHIDVAQIAKDAMARQCAPAELFQLQEGSKLIRVWLE